MKYWPIVENCSSKLVVENFFVSKPCWIFGNHKNNTQKSVSSYLTILYVENPNSDGLKYKNMLFVFHCLFSNVQIWAETYIYVCYVWFDPVVFVIRKNKKLHVENEIKEKFFTHLRLEKQEDMHEGKEKRLIRDAFLHKTNNLSCDTFW